MAASESGVRGWGGHLRTQRHGGELLEARRGGVSKCAIGIGLKAGLELAGAGGHPDAVPQDGTAPSSAGAVPAPATTTEARSTPAILPILTARVPCRARPATDPPPYYETPDRVRKGLEPPAAGTIGACSRWH